MTEFTKYQKAWEKVNDRNSFFNELLIDTLKWNVSPDDIDDCNYDWSDDLGVSQDEFSTIECVEQLRSMTSNQRWGIFFVKTKSLPQGAIRITALRHILRALVPKKRATASRSEQPTWFMEDLLFICTPDWKNYTFIHFDQPPEKGKVARITSFNRIVDEPPRTLYEFNTPPLEFPDDPSDTDKWRDQWLEAFNVEKVTTRFFEEYKKVFEYVEKSITGFGNNKEAKRLFTQKLFNRLMFIAFIQKKGWLKMNGSSDYLNALWKAYKDDDFHNTNFYSDRLRNLFFLGLNNQDEINIVGNKGMLQQIIGNVPYLNGGLFEKEPDDDLPDIKVPDHAIKKIFVELFNRFNFTVTESTPLDQEVAVDPEMLGKVFEELVTGRHESGSYYTPKTVVSFMCKESLKGYLGGYDNLVDAKDTSDISLEIAKTLIDKLSMVKICDPACGSGAYLVGMLHEIHSLMRILDTRADRASARGDYQRKLEIIQKNLYGVDIDNFAINIARLRLWLTLAVEFEGDKPEPLPNLDFKIEQGDSLLAPDPTGRFEQTFADEKIRKLFNLKSDFMKAHPKHDKDRIKEEISLIKKDIKTWIFPGQTIEGFNWAVEFAEVFVDDGFDIVIANPPYGIKCEDPLRYMYFPRNTYNEPQSKDSYGLFMARALQLLKPDGFFSFIVSDTWRTIRTHRPLRRKLLASTTAKHVLDLPSWIFGATVNTCILSLKKNSNNGENSIIAADLRNIPIGRWDLLDVNLIAVGAKSPDIQTLEYARYTYQQKLISTYQNLSFFIGSPKLYELMSDDRFVRLGDIAEVKQGLATADNQYYLRKRERARGSYQILDESKLLTEEEIANLSDDEKANGVNPADYGGRHFVPYDKGGASDSSGGWLPNFYVPTEYFVDWSIASLKRMKTFRSKKQSSKVASRFQNSDYYFKQGITFSDTGFYAPTFRFGAASVFDVTGMTIFMNSLDVKPALGLLNSVFIRYLVKNIINHTVNTQVDGIKPIPFPKDFKGYDVSLTSLKRMKTFRSKKQSSKVASRFRNSDYYFKQGITFSDTGFYAPTFRFGAASVFDVMGMAIFMNSLDVKPALGLLNSVFIRYLVKNIINHTVHTQVGGINPIPFPKDFKGYDVSLTESVVSIITKQKKDRYYPYHRHEQKEIDALVYQLYDLTDDDIREVELWYCRRYPKLAQAQGFVDEVREKYASYLERCDNILTNCSLTI